MPEWLRFIAKIYKASKRIIVLVELLAIQNQNKTFHSIEKDDDNLENIEKNMLMSKSIAIGFFFFFFF
jgi:hypothetical protein